MKIDFTKWIKIDNASVVPKYEQIVNSVLDMIEAKKIKKNTFLPSINTLYKDIGVSRDTLINAYKCLQSRGVIDSRHGKGFYFIVNKINRKQRVFILFDQLSAYKEVLYNSLISNLGNKFEVDIYFYHFNKKIFNTLINANIGKYDYYIIMPHFNEPISDFLKDIPLDKLLIIDKDIPELKGKVAAVFQNYEKDIYLALRDNIKLIKKYDELFLLFDWKNLYLPQGIINGYNHFCKEFAIRGNIITKMIEGEIEKNKVFIVNDDYHLTTIIKTIKRKKLQLGKDIGIISYNDIPLKEVVADGLTVLSTDFELMGKEASQMIKRKIYRRIENPFQLIVRNSL